MLTFKLSDLLETFVKLYVGLWSIRAILIIILVLLLLVWLKKKGIL